MPPWANRVDKDKHYTFDESFRWELVKYIRYFGYSTEKDPLLELLDIDVKEKGKNEK